jgi:hypothetical protein
MSSLGQPDPNELAKLRALEYRDRYESMRDLEWKVIVQVYVGYAGVAAVFFKLIDQFGHHSAFRLVALSGTLGFFLAAQYLYYRIQERLIIFNETHTYYMKMVIPELDDPPKELGLGQRALAHQYFWTYETQSILSALTAFGLMAYEAVIGRPMPKELAYFGEMFIPFVLVGTVVSISMDRSLRAKRDYIDEKLRNFNPSERNAAAAQSSQR